MIPKEAICQFCGGIHDSNSSEDFVDFEWGNPPELRRFRTPFYCLCCGIEICARQFAWSRNCGHCDTGACQRKLFIYEKGHGQNLFYKGELIEEE